MATSPVVNTSAVSPQNDSLGTCLSQNISRNQHRLDKEDNARQCFEANKEQLSKQACYHYLRKVIEPLDSIRLSNDLRTLCFYEALPLPTTIEACLSETKRFENASAHDEAVFYCYQQFQNQIDQKTCLKTAKLLIFPQKENYLTQHCLSK
ncbi:hypothetical protein A11Q_2039 [Pseudobdellovibrio exovorus JSS]|uniref:Uncharacterized protein n=2 Tax=Pseudobdellovibrio exovorus TaxID=453816 RepID=M4VCP1_9BACT|nr:hypothetical protein A11Q_2039 [Pseudobdellovibrio exovorus JSS]